MSSTKCQAKKQPCNNPKCPDRQAFFAGTSVAAAASASVQKKTVAGEAPQKLTLKEQRAAARSKRDFAGNDVMAERKNARNTSDQSEIQSFVSHKDTILRMQAASNVNANAETLEKFSTDSDWGVRKAVASHKNTPRSVLEKLANDKETFVSSSAQQRL